MLQQWQLRDLEALDPAWCDLAGRPMSKPVSVRRAYIERPRGHSKTTDMALQIGWILLAARSRVNGIAAAADRGQAGFLRDSLRRLAEANRSFFSPLCFLEGQVRNQLTGSWLEVISSDARSSYGALPDFIVCDELTHWKKGDLWHSLLSSAAKKPKCVLTILTNAGVGRGWQWDVREHARIDSGWHFSSLNGPHAPWITDDTLTEQREMLPESVFERLWLNHWQQSEGSFLTLAEVEACRDPSRLQAEAGLAGRQYVAAVDYAEKRDYTAACICHREAELIVVDRMDVVKPTKSSPTRVDWVENWMERSAATFPCIRFVVDEYQLLGTIQRLESRYPVERFAFRGGTGNHRLALLLRQLIVHQQIAWYPGCGAVPGEQRDDLETELASLILRQREGGQVRIDHIQDGLHHDDRAFALGVACLSLQEQSPGHDFLEITPSVPSGFDW
ncbi:terminase large subunit domain-containing protein [Planctomicrobium sp. SH664]|uniref:terminase large subunit domain-containing protein n=1 Tax=Planctomicrobium sp. SH664 TaxID=3448125 RepID=UPI003F5AFD60